MEPTRARSLAASALRPAMAPDGASHVRVHTSTAYATATALEGGGRRAPMRALVQIDRTRLEGAAVATAHAHMAIPPPLSVEANGGKFRRHWRHRIAYCPRGGDTFIEVRVQAVRSKLYPLAAERLTLALC